MSMCVTWGSMEGAEARANVALEQECYEQAKAEIIARSNGASAFEHLRDVLKRAQEIKRERKAAQ